MTLNFNLTFTSPESYLRLFIWKVIQTWQRYQNWDHYTYKVSLSILKKAYSETSILRYSPRLVVLCCLILSVEMIFWGGSNELFPYPLHIDRRLQMSLQKKIVIYFFIFFY